MSITTNYLGSSVAGNTLPGRIEQLVETVPLSIAQEEPGLFVILVLVFFVGFAIMGIGGKQFQTGRLIKNTAPERVRSVAIGRTELRGTARDAGVVFDQPFTDGKCLYYSYSVKRYVEKEVKDDDGNTKKERSWETISSHSLAAPFYLDDGTGKILVVANAGADFQISGDNTFSKTFKGRIPGSYRRGIDTSVDISDAISEDIEWEPHNLITKIESKVPLLSVPGSSNDLKPRSSGSPSRPSFSSSGPSNGRVLKRRITQTVLPVDEDVYVYGAARQRADPMGANEQRLVIQGDDDTGRFIVSDKGEDALARRYTLVGLGFLAVGLLVSAVTFGILTDGLL